MVGCSDSSGGVVKGLSESRAVDLLRALGQDRWRDNKQKGRQSKAQAREPGAHQLKVSAGKALSCFLVCIWGWAQYCELRCRHVICSGGLHQGGCWGEWGWCGLHDLIAKAIGSELLGLGGQLRAHLQSATQ